MAIADILQVPVTDLLSGTGKGGPTMRNKMPCEILAMTREGNRLAIAFNTLDPPFRALALELMEGLADKLNALGRRAG